MGGMDEQCNKATTLTTGEIPNKSKEMAAPTKEREPAAISSGQKWYRLFKTRNLGLHESAAETCDSQCADAKLTEEEVITFFKEKLHPALSRVNMKAQCMYNQDESGYFRCFLVNGKVWARKGRSWVARGRGYDPICITAMVYVSVVGKTVTLALLWTWKNVLFSKDACPMFIKAAQDDSKKDSKKAASGSDTKAHDSNKK